MSDMTDVVGKTIRDAICKISNEILEEHPQILDKLKKDMLLAYKKAVNSIDYSKLTKKFQEELLEAVDQYVSDRIPDLDMDIDEALETIQERLGIAISNYIAKDLLSKPIHQLPEKSKAKRKK